MGCRTSELVDWSHLSWRHSLLLSELPLAPIGNRLLRTDFDDDSLSLGIATTTANAS